MRFFAGLHQPADAEKLADAGHEDCLISYNRLRERKADFKACNWILDCGAFSEIQKYGKHRISCSEYAREIKRWSACGKLIAAVSMDYPLDPYCFYMNDVKGAQIRSCLNYEQLCYQDTGGVYIMPVLQGITPEDYYWHTFSNSSKLKEGAWVGVGSLVRHNTNPSMIIDIVKAIRLKRPDLKLHGFGLKADALKSEKVTKLFYSADSIAWSFAARYEGRNQNDCMEAVRYINRMNRVGMQSSLF